MKIRRLAKGELSFFIISGIISIIALLASLKMFMKDQNLSSQGAFPLFCSSVMVIMFIMILFEMKKYEAAFEKKTEVLEKIKATFSMLFPGKIFPEIVMIILYGIILPHVGFVISTFLFLWLSMIMLNRNNKKKSFVISIGIVLGILLLFQFAFRVILP
jgi:putative tricarboxylic transport membrane protein